MYKSRKWREKRKITQVIFGGVGGGGGALFDWGLILFIGRGDGKIERSQSAHKHLSLSLYSCRAGLFKA